MIYVLEDRHYEKLNKPVFHYLFYISINLLLKNKAKQYKHGHAWTLT